MYKSVCHSNYFLVCRSNWPWILLYSHLTTEFYLIHVIFVQCDAVWHGLPRTCLAIATSFIFVLEISFWRFSNLVKFHQIWKIDFLVRTWRLCRRYWIETCNSFAVRCSLTWDTSYMSWDSTIFFFCSRNIILKIFKFGHFDQIWKSDFCECTSISWHH